MNKNDFVEGKSYIRIAPYLMNGQENWKYTDLAITYRGMVDGFLRFQNLGEVPFSLDKSWNDGNWILYDDIRNMEKTSLNDLAGRLIKRIRPIKNCDNYFKEYYMKKSNKLVCATKYHVILVDEWGEEILDSRFTDPDDWIEDIDLKE